MFELNMENYLHPEISEKRRLCLPEGLKDLMSDITRESKYPAHLVLCSIAEHYRVLDKTLFNNFKVLRAQPAQLYRFISDYLSAMLITREHLTIASRLNEDICCCLSEYELGEKLKQLGISNEDSKKATDIINSYFTKKAQVIECNVIQKITKTVRIAEEQIPYLQQAIRESFLKRNAQRVHFEKALVKCSSDDEISKAVEHTLRIYRQVEPSEAEFNRMAIKIQAAYRAYGVTRHLSKHNSPTLADDSNPDISPKLSDESIIDIEDDEEGEEKTPNKVTLTIKSPPHFNFNLEEEVEILEHIESEHDESEVKSSIEILKSCSVEEIRQKRFVSFNAEEKELDNFDYQNKSALSVNTVNQSDVEKDIEEDIVVADDNLSLAEDCESIYDIDYDDISDSDVFVD